MQVSQITIKDVAEYLRLDSDVVESETVTLTAILDTAKRYIADYTGIPQEKVDENTETLDDHEDFYIVVMVLCQDMYDNRSYYVDKSNVNKVVETILGMHCRNLI